MCVGNKLFVKVDGGIGRCIAATGAVVKYALEHQKVGDEVYVVTPFPFIFDGLPAIERVLRADHATLFEDYLSAGEYVEVEPYNSSFHYRDGGHLCSAWNWLLNGDKAFIEPQLALSKNELATGQAWVEQVRKKNGKKVVLVQPWGATGGMKQCGGNCAGGTINFDETLRSLELDNVNGLVSKLMPECEVFLVKDYNQLDINGTMPFTGNIREIMSVLPFIDGILCCDSFLHHAAKAVGATCPVVVFWGSTNPTQFGYVGHYVIENKFDRKVEPNRLPHDHSYYVRKNKGCNVFSEAQEDAAVKLLYEKGA